MIEQKDNNLVIGDSWDELGIDIPVHKTYSQVDIKLRGCPKCEELGKKRDTSLSINPSKGIGRCHKCGTSYAIRRKLTDNRQSKEQSYTPPSRRNITGLSDEGLQFFVDRRITQHAVEKHKIAERGDMVAFPYFFKGELVNIKYRGIDDKKFSQSGGGMHVMFNHDGAIDHLSSISSLSTPILRMQSAVVVVEGEMDVLSFSSCLSIEIPAVSVDSGAPNPKDNIDRKLECLKNSYEIFERANTIYIAVDNDENGRRLQDELIRRLEFDKIRIVDWGKYKDANDCLMWEGEEGLVQVLRNAKDLVMDGIYSLEAVEDRVWDIYVNGLPKGTTTHFPSIDPYFKWRLGEVTVVTGYNNEGKSAVMVNLALMKAVFDGWPWAIFSPENFPVEEWYEDVLHTYIGKTLDHDYKYCATEDDLKKAINDLHEKFFLVFPEEAQTLEELLKRFDWLVRKYGVRGIIIDPYNQIDHMMQRQETIDLYVSRFMSVLKRFARTRNVAIILIAHQNPPKTRQQDGNYPEPDLYSIKNGGTIPDKADNVLAIWRPYRKSDESNPLVHFISGKIKKKKLTGNTGTAEIAFDWKSNRFLDKELNGGCNPLGVSLVKSIESAFDKPKQEIKEKWHGELF